MRKIIWTCWFQGAEHAPELVRACIESWRSRNPGWDLRCLDARTVAHYVDLAAHVDLSRQQITAASLSDILRLLLLHEYGGVWVDATTFCNTPLDEWIEPAMHEGFFAFDRPGGDRPLASWFLAARPGNRLLAAWAARALAYWQDRACTQDYFWVHHQFDELLAIDRQAFSDWFATPQISADGPHSVQGAGFANDYDAVRDLVDWSAPVFKLTYRYDPADLNENSLLTRLLGLTGEGTTRVSSSHPPPTDALPIAHLRVGTENLGDHIQIIAAERLLALAGLTPNQWVNRDDEIANPPAVGRSGILLNGWFKTNPAQWPPHPAFVPLYLGFHIRLFQSPSLIGPEAIAHYREQGPVGCRDRHTLRLLRTHGVESFLSHCLTLTYPRRLPDPQTQNEVFVVSRDERLRDYLPDDLGAYTFINHYSGDNDFVANMDRARALLETYRGKARLIVTTLLHCALPAIAMGIPVVVFYPPNEGAARESDRERFSSLADILRVHDLTDAGQVDWQGSCPDVGAIKLALMDHFFAMAQQRWGDVATPPIKGIAPSSVLPVPDASTSYSYLNDPERLARLAQTGVPDRQKWGIASSYNPQWAARAQLAATHIVDREKVLEVGVGGGDFRDLITGRCPWLGTDLQPVLPDVLALDLETDPLPFGPWDVVVMLGVLEYIHDPAVVLSKLFAAGDKVVMSYCVPRAGDVVQVRRERGWVSDLALEALLGAAALAGFTLTQTTAFNSAEDFDQSIFVFIRDPLVLR